MQLPRSEDDLADDLLAPFDESPRLTSKELDKELAEFLQDHVALTATVDGLQAFSPEPSMKMRNRTSRKAMEDVIEARRREGEAERKKRMEELAVEMQDADAEIGRRCELAAARVMLIAQDVGLGGVGEACAEFGRTTDRVIMKLDRLGELRKGLEHTYARRPSRLEDIMDAYAQ